jgi:transposase InsO family protein
LARCEGEGRTPQAVLEIEHLADTPEFVIGESGKLYLAAMLDLFSRFVVGWAVGPSNDRHLTLRALGMALKRRYPEVGLLHHSDRGSTYASSDYQQLLERHGLTCSMSRRGNCYDNAVMEAFFSRLKDVSSGAGDDDALLIELTATLLARIESALRRARRGAV